MARPGNTGTRARVRGPPRAWKGVFGENETHAASALARPRADGLRLLHIAGRALAFSAPSLRAAASAAPAPTAAASPQPAADYALPEQLTIGDNGVPLVEVYLAEEEVVETMDFESYLAGVLAGEMHNDWPLEALKAQAIIARTFALRFIEDGGSQYAGAQLSTDIGEAQAYDMSQVNDRIRQAVEETRGLVILCEGEPIQGLVPRARGRRDGPGAGGTGL